MVRTYRDARTRKTTPYGDVLVALLWLCFPAAILTGCFAGGNLLAFLALIPLAVLWSWPVYNDLFRRCDEIRLSDEGTCEFESPLRRIRLRTHELVSVRPARWVYNDRAYTEFRYEGGRLWVVQPIENFGDFLTRLDRLHPLLEVRDRSRILRSAELSS